MDFTSLQVEIVREIAGSLQGSGWKALIFDCEIREVSDGYDFDSVGVVLLEGERGELSQDQFDIEIGTEDLCIELYKNRLEEAEYRIAGFTVKIENTGQYRYEFKHDLRRLNGVWDEKTEGYLEDYLEHYLVERRDVK